MKITSEKVIKMLAALFDIDIASKEWVYNATINTVDKTVLFSIKREDDIYFVKSEAEHISIYLTNKGIDLFVTYNGSNFSIHQDIVR